MTVVNPKSISGITSITTASGSDDLLTIHTNNGTERLRVDSTGATKIVTGIVTTLTATTGIVTTLTASTVTSLGDVDIADKIVHTGDTNTAIRFPAADTITAETSGAEAIRINNSGQLLVGVTAARTVFSGYTPSLQVEGTANSDSSVSIVENISAASGPSLWFGKTRGTSLGANTVVQSGDELGTIVFNGADGTDVQSMAAFIRASVDGTPGSNDMPGRITFHTTDDGSASPTERLRITSTGKIGITEPSPSNYGIHASQSSESVYYRADSGSVDSIFGSASSLGYSIAGTTSNHAFVFFANNAEKLRISTNGQIATRGATGTGFNNAGAGDFGSFLTINGGHTSNQWGILSLEGNTSASGYTVGAIQFINQNNANSSSGGNTQSRLLAKIDAHSVTSDSNAGDDSGGTLRFYTKPEAGTPAERLRIASNGYITQAFKPVKTAQDTNVQNISGERFVIDLPSTSRMFRITGSFSFNNGIYRIWGDLGANWSDGHTPSIEGFANWWQDGAGGPTYQDVISGQYFEVADPVDSGFEVTYDLLLTTMAHNGTARPGVSGNISWTYNGVGRAWTVFSYQDTAASGTDRLTQWAWDIDIVSGTMGTGQHQYVIEQYPITQ